MKFLFITSGSAATVFAVAPLATAVRNAGHEVLMTGNESLMESVEAIGVPGVSIMPESIRHFMETDAAGDARRRPRDPRDYILSDPREELLRVGRGFARMASAGLDPLVELAEEWPPDVIVGGSMSYAAGLLATRLKVPYVRQAEYLEIPTSGIDPGAQEELKPELKHLGLTELPDPDLFIDVCPPSLRPPNSPDAQPMRWIPSNLQRRLKAWMYTRPKGRYRVVITSGSRGLMFRDPGWSMRHLVGELTLAGAEVVIAAPEAAAERFGAELGDIRIGWIPLDVVAPTCDLAIHHGGATTAMTIVNAGIPQLIIPENPDDIPANSHRESIAQALSGFGAALTVLPQQQPDSDPGELIAAGCRELLSSPRYARQARALATETATLPTPPEVVLALEALAAP